MSRTVITCDRLSKKYTLGGHPKNGLHGGPPHLREAVSRRIAVRPGRPHGQAGQDAQGRPCVLGAEGRLLRGRAGRGRRHRRPQRRRQVDPAEGPQPDRRADRGLGPPPRPDRLAAGGRHRVPRRAHRPREHLHERHHPRDEEGRDRPQVRRDRRLLGDRGVPRHPGEAVFLGDVRPAGLRRGGAPGARDPDRRRGARRRRLLVPEEVPGQDAGRGHERRPDHPVRQPQRGGAGPALPARDPAPGGDGHGGRADPGRDRRIPQRAVGPPDGPGGVRRQPVQALPVPLGGDPPRGRHPGVGDSAATSRSSSAWSCRSGGPSPT